MKKVLLAVIIFMAGAGLVFSQVEPIPQVTAQTVTRAALPAEAVQPAQVTAQAAQADPVPVTGSAAPLTLTAAALTVTAAAYDPAAGVKLNFDASGINSLKLVWSKKPEESFYYNVFRKEKMRPNDYVAINKEPFAAETFVDEAITPGTAYYYKVEFKMADGASYFTEPFEAKAAEVFQPKRITDFKAIAETESVVLKWAAPAKGSYDVSGYNIYRGKTKEEMAFYKFVQAGKTVYEDEEVEAALKYYYKVMAVDVKNNEAPESVIAVAVPYPLPNTGLVLMPTAYRNDIYNNLGLNFDMLFSYYIGNLYGQHEDQPFGTVTDAFTKSGIWLLTGDVKGSVFNDFDRMPSLALGYMYTILLQDQIGSSETTGVSKSFNISEKGDNGALITQSGFYGAISKKLLWDTHFHGGYMYGNQANFQPYLTRYIYTEEWMKSNQSYYAGISRKLFRKVGLKVEYIVPLQGANSNAFMPRQYLINTHIDSFIRFDVGYFHYETGYAWLGYISFRFTIFPNPYK
jgi:hypothetical protein